MIEFIKFILENGELLRKSKSKSYTIDTSEEIELGSERNWGHRKSFVGLKFEGGNRLRNIGRYVTKEFRDKANALYELEKVLILESVGIPVPQTHRYAHDVLTGQHIILYSDLTENGQSQIWSLSNPETDFSKLQLTKAEISQITVKLQEIAQKAVEVGYILDSDAYFIQRNANGEANIIIGDFGIGVFTSSRERAMRVNSREANEFAAKLVSLSK